jgi:hypothetical protein
MHLMTQTTHRGDSSIVVMFTLMPRELPRDSDEGIEIVFRAGLVDGNGESPDFVVPLEDIAGAIPTATFEIADESLGMALRVLSQHLDQTISQVAAFVAERCEKANSQPVTIGSPQTV